MNEQARAILNEYYRRLSADPKVRGILHRIEIGNANLADTAALSDRASDLLGELFGAAILDIPEDVREAVCEGLLRERYDSMNETLAAVQTALDEAQGIHLTPQKAPFPTERVQQIAHSLLDPNAKPETIRRRANKPVATVAKSFHDDYIRTNARVRNDLGFKCYLDRVAAPGCCAWCTGIAGRYIYGDHPADIFRRHDNCSCTVTFENGRQRQDVWSKRSWDAKDPKEIERVASRPAVMSRQQAEQLQNTALSRLTLGGRRDIIGSEGVNPMIHAIEQPIEQQHTGKGNPNAILTFDVPLNNRQQALLEHLPEYDSRVKVRKREVNMADLAALTAKTGHEFAMFTRKQERLIIRGNAVKVNISLDDAKALASDGYRWSGHTHPGDTLNCLMPSGGDKAVLEQFPQKTSVIYNSKGQYATFEKGV
ncbi:MAG: hypothetical protein II916_09055 [Oscillospiraceae bacterium]|nr:hypothetical protein [Oscillospiraceae bacterium]